jgi:hypothetical protein
LVSSFSHWLTVYGSNSEAPLSPPQIQGASQTARAQTAKGRAEEIDADIVVHGMLTTDGNMTLLQPELYLSDSIQADAGETVGDHQGGRALELSGDPESNQLATQLFGEPLSERPRRWPAWSLASGITT